MKKIEVVISQPESMQEAYIRFNRMIQGSVVESVHAVSQKNFFSDKDDVIFYATVARKKYETETQG